MNPSQNRSESNQGGSSDRVKRDRRKWTRLEEDVFLECFKEYAVTGGRCESGFRANYLKDLQKLMETRLPNCDLKATPHIESKVKIWKNLWGGVHDFVTKSGHGSFNTITKMVDVTEAHWKELLEHERVKYSALKDKSFPMYEAWCEIFAKDRANGDLSCGGNEDNNLEDMGTSEMPDGAGVSQAEIGSSSTEPFGVNDSPSTEAEPSKKAGKRKAMNDPITLINNLAEKLDSVAAANRKTFMEAATMFCGDPEDRKAAGAIIRSMNLSAKQKGEICSKILNDRTMLECFLSMNDDERFDWICELI